MQDHVGVGVEPVALVCGIDGERALPEQTLDHLSGYEGARPVRIGNDAYGQRQHDMWGAVLDSVYLHTRSRELLDTPGAPTESNVSRLCNSDCLEAAVKDAVALLKLMLNPHDDLALARIKAAYKTIYRSGLNRTQAFHALSAQPDADTPEVRALIEFAAGTKRGLCSGPD